MKEIHKRSLHAGVPNSGYLYNKNSFSGGRYLGPLISPNFHIQDWNRQKTSVGTFGFLSAGVCLVRALLGVYSLHLKAPDFGKLPLSISKTGASHDERNSQAFPPCRGSEQRVSL